MNPQTKDRLLSVGVVALMCLGGFSTSGCSSTPHCEGDLACELKYGTDMDLRYQHVSHLSAGWPTGPSNEEDTLDHVSLCAARKAGILVTEVCYGRLLRDGGFYGPQDTAQFNVSLPIWKGSETRR